MITTSQLVEGAMRMAAADALEKLAADPDFWESDDLEQFILARAKQVRERVLS